MAYTMMKNPPVTNEQAVGERPRWDWLPRNVLGKSEEELAQLYVPWKAPFVLLPSGETAHWDLTCNHRSGWESIAWHGSLPKPSSAALGLMVTLVRKSGEFGILLTMDYCSDKSEIRGADYPPREELTKILLSGLKDLQDKIPSADFALVADPAHPESRLNAIAFIRHGILHKDACAAINGLMFLA